MDSYKFGEYPLFVYVGLDGSHAVAAYAVEEAEACGIPASFAADRLPAMEARAAAHGYVFVPVDADAAGT